MTYNLEEHQSFKTLSHWYKWFSQSISSTMLSLESHCPSLQRQGPGEKTAALWSGRRCGRAAAQFEVQQTHSHTNSRLFSWGLTVQLFIPSHTKEGRCSSHLILSYLGVDMYRDFQGLCTSHILMGLRGSRRTIQVPQVISQKQHKWVLFHRLYKPLGSVLAMLTRWATGQHLRHQHTN